MLRNIANDLLYLLSILESIGKILKYTEKYSEPELFFESDDQIQFNASLLLLANIGEASGKISDELKNKHNKIPWKIMKNFRNKITHDYVNIDFFIVFDVIKNELPKVKIELEKIIAEELIVKKFVKEEYEVCIGNMYYRHIDFDKINNFLK